MKKAIVPFSRIFVGVLFIISGLIKLNDPIGFSYKLAEYFGETILNLPFLIPYSLAIAVLVVVSETVLGCMLLVGFKPKFTIWSLLLMIVFFSFLTFYSAYFNKVTDCGCFGDALKLKPWQSFYKDIILLFFILILFFNSKLVNPLFNNKTRVTLVVTSLFLCFFMGYWVLNHLPLIDFRPYKIGTNINEGMRVPDNAPKSVIEMLFIYNVNGVIKEFSEKDLMAIPVGAKFVDRKDKIIVEGYKPPIHDFSIEKEGENFTEMILSKPKVMLFVSYDVVLSDPDGMKKLQKLYLEAQSKGYFVVGISASVGEDIKKVKQKYGLTFDFYFCDGTTLKTIERANPSVVVIENATIVQKVHYNDIDKLNL